MRAAPAGTWLVFRETGTVVGTVVWHLTGLDWVLMPLRGHREPRETFLGGQSSEEESERAGEAWPA